MIFPDKRYKYNYQEYIGQIFGSWTVKAFEFIKTIKYTKPFFICICKCGTESKIQTYRLFSKLSLSCKFCAPKKHGLYKTPTNRSWSGAKNRCNNPKNKDYIHYGARGIKFSERWDKFENFLADMGEKPEGLTLDRIDNNGNYEPGNCRWATYSQQNSNQRKRNIEKGAQ